MIKIKPSNTTSTSRSAAKSRRQVEEDILGKQKIIVIAGPTASGKSDLALKLAQKYNGEVISADSRQVYRGMDIGTGKVSKKERRLVKHHLIDVVNPKQIFTVSKFKKLGERAIKDISNRNKLPIIVGGTGQYIDILIYNLALPEVQPNYKLRAKLEKQTPKQLFAQLKKFDPERAKNIDRHNPRRLIRALEIIESLGKVPSLELGIKNQELSYQILWIGLNPKNLEQRISTRLSARFRQGMISEVKKLAINLYSPIRANKRISPRAWQRLYDLGLEYRWIGQYLQNKISKKEMRSGLTQASRQYSKRQMTWFKRNKEIIWNKNYTQTTRLIDKFLR